MRHQPTADDLERLARDAYARLPEGVRQLTEGVVIRVVDFADPEVLDDLGIDDPYDLLGLYQGIHIGEKGVDLSGALPDMIFLYAEPLLSFWRAGTDSLDAVITHVLVHEIGHHFGLSDEDMHRIEDAAGD